MNCKYCGGDFCMKCFRLEVHNCIGIETKKEEQRKELKDKLAYEPPPKHLKIWWVGRVEWETLWCWDVRVV